MRVTFLGTGTSQGVPLINCQCPVCISENQKNKRLRCSVMVETGDNNILIDTSMDMRQQFLSYRFSRIDAVLYTHAHADHIFGMDELRRFNIIQNEIIPVYASGQTMEYLKRTFYYAFTENELRPGIPNIRGNIIDGPFQIGSSEIIPIPLNHGDERIYGFRIGAFAYCTDVNSIPEESYPLLKGLKVLVLTALRERKHPKHFSLNEAITEAKKINAEMTYFNHVSHILDHDTHNSYLDETMELAYDGLTVSI
ncbi:MAG: MBL fold metallo-hydrolase [Caldithrix sp.]|nr:MBL fold metallo-hydrolase [Caldithrix sp.]